MAVMAQTMVADETDVYSLGGNDFGDQKIHFNSVFRLRNHTWEALAHMHYKRSGAAVAILNRTLFAIGGFNNALQFLPFVEALDLDTGLWNNRTSLPIAVYQGSAAFYNDTIWVCGMYDCQIYSPSDDTWSFGPSMNRTRWPLSGLAVGLRGQKSLTGRASNWWWCRAICTRWVVTIGRRIGA